MCWTPILRGRFCAWCVTWARPASGWALVLIFATCGASHGSVAISARTPSRSAYDLAQAWPRARLDIVAMAGHRWNDPHLSRAVVRATDRLGKLVSR